MPHVAMAVAIGIGSAAIGRFILLRDDPAAVLRQVEAAISAGASSGSWPKPTACSPTACSPTAGRAPRRACIGRITRSAG